MKHTCNMDKTESQAHSKRSKLRGVMMGQDPSPSLRSKSCILDCDRWLKLDLADVSEKHIVLLVSLWALSVCLFAGYRSQFLTYGPNFLAQGSLGDSPDMIFFFYM